MSGMLAIVTGAGTGIGAALARRLALAGHDVLAVGRRIAPLQRTAAACTGGRVQPCDADVASAEGRQRVLEALPAGRQVNFLVQNAAVGVPATLEHITEADFLEALRVNVAGPLFLVQGLLPRFAAGARILHVGTGLAHGPRAQLGGISYAVSKAAFHRLYEQLGVELGTRGISVGSARPGVVATEGMREHVDRARAAGLPHAAWFEELMARGEDEPVDRVAVFFEFLLTRVGASEFAASEWHINDQGHWERWDDPALRGPASSRQLTPPGSRPVTRSSL